MADNSDENKEDTAILEDQVGMTVATKDLYREDLYHDWEEWSPEDIGIQMNDNPASTKFALVVRREKSKSDTEQTALAVHSITVQSPILKRLLAPVFEGYQGINTNLKKLDFETPFHEFFYRAVEFSKAKTDADDGLSLSHYQLLSDIISSELKPHIERAADLINNEVMSFDYLWTLFEPGSEIYSEVAGNARLYILSGTRYQELCDEKRFVLTCRYVDTDGDNFGYVSTTLVIREYENVKPLAELNVLPAHLQKGIQEIRTRLEERGRKFEKLQGFHYESYHGFYNVPVLGGTEKRYIERGRVIVDCSTFIRYNPATSDDLEPLNAPASSKHLNILSALQDFEDDGEDDASLVPPAIQIEIGYSHSKKRMVHSPTVRGFCLATKDWVYLQVDNIQDIEWSVDAFDRLVLPFDYKRVVWAFVKAQISKSDDFDDLVKGKGQGFIMLLSGEPGTGKTLTAESVSEAMKKPLYSMAAGELGIEAGEVERNLQRVLEISSKWGAVLLIDECDVFMVKRSSTDLRRNQLVSVFLRLLEYYKGVLFLTTNRVDSFDPAFESRIHVTFNYPNLDHESRLHVWQTFINRSSSTCNISDQDLVEIARVELNGRQIKNIVKTARLLASVDQCPLSLHHINTVFRVKQGSPAAFEN